MDFPSILNEVIGPVMRGPSSSHCAAAVRIGTLARALMDGCVEEVFLEFDEKGSLAATHDSQGSDMGFCAGLLGYAPDDERMTAYEEKMARAGIRISYAVGSYGDPHPNTFRIRLKNKKEVHSIKALSVGGGMIELIEVDGHEISVTGDCFVTLVYFEDNGQHIMTCLEKTGLSFRVLESHGRDCTILALHSRKPLAVKLAGRLSGTNGVTAVKQLPPVLPVLSPEKFNAPFENASGLLTRCRKFEMDLGAAAIEYESLRGGTGKNEVLNEMIRLVRIMTSSIHQGIKGTKYQDRILHHQSCKLVAGRENNRLPDLGMLNTIMVYVTALMEMKSAMGVIVAAPTAGSCGGLPGTLIGAADVLGCDVDATARAMFAAGMVGALIAKESTFAAEECGCQAECGAGSGMAAAGLVTLWGGTCEQALAAASMALQNTLGMVCDPVAGRVEVPCLGKNIMAASNAVTSANMALAGFDPVVPLDEVISAMDDVGRKIDPSLRCTALAGLSITPSSKKIEKMLDSPE